MFDLPIDPFGITFSAAPVPRWSCSDEETLRAGRHPSPAPWWLTYFTV
jgi:hypothetical protein